MAWFLIERGDKMINLDTENLREIAIRITEHNTFVVESKEIRQISYMEGEIVDKIPLYEGSLEECLNMLERIKDGIFSNAKVIDLTK